MMKFVVRSIVIPASVVSAAVLVWMAFAAPIGQVVYERAAERNVPRDLVHELDDGLHVILCGTGSPMPDPSRMGPCTAVVAGDRVFVVDVGEGAARNFGPMGLRIAETDAILLTHFHSDHISGLGDFLVQRWANSGAVAPLSVYGPPGASRLIESLNTLYSFDKSYRVAHHGETIMPTGGFGGAANEFALDERGEKVLLSDNDLKITAFAVDHGAIEPAVGYRFDYKGRSVVISGDTAQSKNLERHSIGVDLLVHEALADEMVDVMASAFDEDGRARLATIFEQIKDIHSTPEEAADSAARAGVEMLVLTHIIPPAPSKLLSAYFVRGASDRFDGEIVLGRDGMIFSLYSGDNNIHQRMLLR